MQMSYLYVSDLPFENVIYSRHLTSFGSRYCKTNWHQLFICLYASNIVKVCWGTPRLQIMVPQPLWQCYDAIYHQYWRQFVKSPCIAKLTLLISSIYCPSHQPVLVLTLALYVPPVSHTRCLHEQRFYRTDYEVHVSVTPSRRCSPCHGNNEYQQCQLGSYQNTLRGPVHHLSPKYRRHLPTLWLIKRQERTKGHFPLDKALVQQMTKCYFGACVFKWVSCYLKGARRLVSKCQRGCFPAFCGSLPDDKEGGGGARCAYLPQPSNIWGLLVLKRWSFICFLWNFLLIFYQLAYKPSTWYK